MYMCRLKHINDPVLSSLKMEGIRLFYLFIYFLSDSRVLGKQCNLELRLRGIGKKTEIDLCVVYQKCTENYWKFEDSIDNSFRKVVQMIDRRLEGLKIPDRQRNFDITKINK
jgi:hypothetical protein